MSVDELTALEQAAAPVRVTLAMHGIRKRWGGLPVLEELELELEPGRLTWVGGANGAGKTTLLRIAAGLIWADSGGVLLDDHLHPERDRREYLRRIGYLSAGSGALYARLSPRRQLDFAARIALVPQSERAAAIGEGLKRFRLDELAERRVDRLSMGQRQRLRLALTLVHRPDVLLLDEPFNSLDEDGIEVFRSAIVDTLTRGGVAVVCAPGGRPLPIEHDEHYRLEGGRLHLE